MIRALAIGATILVGITFAGPGLAASEPATDLKAIWSSLTPEEQASYEAAGRRLAAASPVGTLTPGDTCAAATFEVSALPFNDANTTVGQTDNMTFGAACNGFNGSSGVGPDLAYLVQTDITCDLTVTMDPVANDLALWVVTDCADPVGGCVGGDDAGGNGTAESVSFTATAGTDFFIVVDGFGGASDAFTLNIVETTQTGCALVGDPVPGYGSTPPPPGPIDFGPVGIGVTATAILNIEETGDGDLTVSNPLIAGPNAGDFGIEAVFPLTIVDGGPAVDVELTCTPSTVGPLFATLSLDTNDPTQPTVVYDLTCEGIDNPPVVEIPTLAFWGLALLGLALAVAGTRFLIR